MSSLQQLTRSGVAKGVALPNAVLFPIVFALVALSHATLLRLPYFWDEGGYYIPAALDFYHRYTLIPEFTNAHPPLPNVVLGSVWHVFGFHLLTTRLIVCAFAAAGLLAVLRFSVAMLGPGGGFAVALLTAIYPIWFAQSTLAHADIFAAAFTLSAFALYFAAQGQPDTNSALPTRGIAIALLFSLAALSKETAIIEPAALAGFHLYQAWRIRRSPTAFRSQLLWVGVLALPLLPLLAWYGYHRVATGFTFGNPEYLRYNATANFTIGHIVTALRYRFIHLAWQRNIWFPIALAAACFVLLPRRENKSVILPDRLIRIIAVLVCANWFAFSILGGALLTRYLLPIYPLILLLCVAVWKSTTARWPLLALLSAASFLVALWWSPPAAYAPEDSLTYRDMILVHQQAITFIDNHYPNARVLTSWPAAAELYRPDLGYTDRKIMGPQIDNFTSASIAKAAQEQNQFDTALVFSKNFVPPSLSHFLLAHPGTRRSREFAENRDLSPDEVATRLGGEVVFYTERGGEWASVLRFPRRYDALAMPSPLADRSSSLLNGF